MGSNPTSEGVELFGFPLLALRVFWPGIALVLLLVLILLGLLARPGESFLSSTSPPASTSAPASKGIIPWGAKVTV